MSDRPVSRRLKREAGSERGAALFLVMITISMLAALAGSLALLALTETMIAANYRDAAGALYAADAAVEFVLQEIALVEDWTDVLAAPGQSSFVDGEPAGLRQVGAVSIDLAQATADVDAASRPPVGVVDRPPVLHAFGRFGDLVPTAADRSGPYLAVWVADRSPAPRDENAPPTAVSVAAQAFAERGTRRAVEALAEKTDSSTVRLLAWRELP